MLLGPGYLSATAQGDGPVSKRRCIGFMDDVAKLWAVMHWPAQAAAGWILTAAVRCGAAGCIGLLCCFDALLYLVVGTSFNSVTTASEQH